jgi:hypothetical protein
VEKFRKKLRELSQIMGIPVLKGEFILPAREKSVAGKAGKKKWILKAWIIVWVIGGGGGGLFLVIVKNLCTNV